MNIFIKNTAEKFLLLKPLKNIIVFESNPDFTDNSRALFDEMIKRKVNDNFLLLWATHNSSELPNDLKNIKNVEFADINSFKYKYYYSYYARAFAVSNIFLNKRREEQYYIYLAHGAAFKAIKDKRYSLPKECYGCDFCAYSEFSGKYDAENLNANVNDVNIIETGYPRNDVLFEKNNKCKALFNTEKYIYWLPTFRQKSGDNSSVSSISIPFIYNSEDLEKINNTADESNITLVIKPHPAQDLSKIKINNLSNVKFIDESFLTENKVSNYEVLADSCALLSDYSSVFYDYLLCDKPIGFCWEDYEIYVKNEGINPDLIEFTECGDKLFTADDLCAFIKDVTLGNDKLKEKREEIKNKVHKYTDSNSASRIVDYLISKKVIK